MTTALLDLVGEIRDAHEAAQSAARDAVTHGIRAGELLLNAKAALPHGRFGAWLAANVEFSERTAQGYMRLAKLDDQKRNAVADLSLRSALHKVSCDAREAERKARWMAPVASAPMASARLNGRRFTVEPCAAENKWCVREWPNDVGEKFNPIAWRRLYQEARGLPQFVEQRAALKAAKQDVSRLERELKEAQERVYSAGDALTGAAVAHCESVHGQPLWGGYRFITVSALMSRVLREKSDEDRHAMARDLLDSRYWPPGHVSTTGTLICGDAFYVRRDLGAAP